MTHVPTRSNRYDTPTDRQYEIPIPFPFPAPPPPPNTHTHTHTAIGTRSSLDWRTDISFHPTHLPVPTNKDVL